MSAEPVARSIADEPHVVYRVTRRGLGLTIVALATRPTLAEAMEDANERAEAARLFKRQGLYLVRHHTSAPRRHALLRRLRQKGLVR